MMSITFKKNVYAYENEKVFNDIRPCALGL